MSYDIFLNSEYKTLSTHYNSNKHKIRIKSNIGFSFLY